MISVNPLTHVILVPKADLKELQSSPTEVRELDLNKFRMWLKDWEDSEEGIYQLKTHDHNTEVSLAGLVYARTIEVLDPYTVELEDGQYTVNCTGANHNLSDKKVANQVSLVVNNAAGLITSAEIQYASFGGGVTIDVNEGVAGTTYNIGTVENPVNNIPDALLIANTRGFETIHVHGDLTLGVGHNVDGFEFVGHSPSKTTITIEDAASTVGCEFKECTVNGILDGNAVFERCIINNINYIEGRIESCILIGVITLTGSSDTRIFNCFDGTPGYDNNPIIDMGGAGRGLSVGAFIGGIDIRNKTGPETIDINVSEGRIVIQDTVTNGTVYCRGIGKVTDNSTGDAIIINEAIYIDDIAFGGDVIIDTVNGISGILFPTGTRGQPSDNLTDALTICANNNIKRLRLRTDLTIEAGHNISDMSIETRGIMGTNITFNVGCSANNSAFRYLNLQGTVNNNDTLIVENCSIFNLENFTGVMQNVSLGQSSELSIGSWAEIYNCHAGGEPGNEPEISIGDSILNIQDYKGNLKLTNKTGDNRTVASFSPGSVTIADTCVVGKIQILGHGEVEADNSGLGCQVDVDGALTRSLIADSVWDEDLTSYSTSGSAGLAIQQMLGLVHHNIYIDNPTYDSDNNLVGSRLRVYNNSNNVGTDIGVISTYTITSVGDGPGKLFTWQQILN